MTQLSTSTTFRHLAKAGLLAGAMFLTFSLYDRLASGKPASYEGEAQATRESPPRQHTTPSDAGRLTIALLGHGGDGHAGGNLTDAIVIARIDLNKPSAALISIPRDLYVTFPDGRAGRINEALSIHASTSSDRLKQVFAHTLGIEVDRIIHTDFRGFVAVVDLAGGIDVTLDTPVRDREFVTSYGELDFPAGVSHLSGRDALFLARSRKTSRHGDLDRAARQRAILLSLEEKFSRIATWRSPLQSYRILREAVSLIHTDLTLLEMAQLANAARTLKRANIHLAGFEDSPESLVASSRVNGASVLVPRNGISAVQDYVARRLGII
ncbi:MAG: LCP family protein [Pseudomonadales bacterium]